MLIFFGLSFFGACLFPFLFSGSVCVRGRRGAHHLTVPEWTHQLACFAPSAALIGATAYIWKRLRCERYGADTVLQRLCASGSPTGSKIAPLDDNDFFGSVCAVDCLLHGGLFWSRAPSFAARSDGDCKRPGPEADVATPPQLRDHRKQKASPITNETHRTSSKWVACFFASGKRCVIF